jgi:basic amino acid/polyamine antiporter, APA family
MNVSGNRTSGLKRHIGYFGLSLFGIGDILGAGIYGLVGKAAGQLGYAVWLAFALSAVAALLTGLSYATLGSRFPLAAGAAYVTEKTFKREWLAYFVGLAICGSGLTSMATATRILAGYLAPLFAGTSELMIAPAIVAAIGFVVFRGIREALWFNALCTLIELSGLVLIIFVGIRWIGAADYLNAVTEANPAGEISFGLVLSGAVLTFYSFLGFEDILNVAEEVKDPARNIPKGLLTAVTVSAGIYVLVSLVAVSVVPPAELAATTQPLVEVVKRAAPWFPIGVYRFIAVFAVCNTLLLNFVMTTRLMYGMSRQGLLPKILGRVHRSRRTPHVATVAVFLAVTLLGSFGAISQMARATSVLLLSSFMLMNVSLMVLQRRPHEPRGAFEAPRWVPAAGALVCGLLLAHSDGSDWWVAGSVLLAIAILYFLQKPTAKMFTSLQPRE